MTHTHGEPKRRGLVGGFPPENVRQPAAHHVATVQHMADVEMFPQGGRMVLVVLQDGRQLEGELHTLTGRYQVGEVVFEPWEIEEFDDVT